MKKSAIFFLILMTGLGAGTLACAEEQDHKSLATLIDGSIVVLSGNKLTKYDGDLNVVKEVELGGQPAPAAMDRMGRMEKPPLEEPAMEELPAAAPEAYIPPPAEPEPSPEQTPEAATGAVPEAPSGQ